METRRSRETRGSYQKLRFESDDDDDGNGELKVNQSTGLKADEDDIKLYMIEMKKQERKERN